MWEYKKVKVFLSIEETVQHLSDKDGSLNDHEDLLFFNTLNREALEGWEYIGQYKETIFGVFKRLRVGIGKGKENHEG